MAAGILGEDTSDFTFVAAMAENACVCRFMLYSPHGHMLGHDHRALITCASLAAISIIILCVRLMSVRVTQVKRPRKGEWQCN
jgi:hypothetical protein